MFLEYIYIFKYSLVYLLIGLLLFALSFIFVYQKQNNEKISSYECGFNIFSDARNKFEIRYYLVAILFIIFDLELLFLFPWIICINNLCYEGIIVMLLFLFLLTIGFIYEWYEGALDWS